MGEEKERKIINIDSVDNYVKCINKFLLMRKSKNKKKSRLVYYYRGFANDDEKIAKIFRGDKKLLINNEFRFIEKYEKNISYLLPQYRNYLDLVASCDHYGIKTRLIDWSSSPFIATLFALTKSANEYFLLVKSENDFCKIEHLPYDGNLIDERYTLSIKYRSAIERYKKLQSDIKKSKDKLILIKSKKNIVKEMMEKIVDDRCDVSDLLLGVLNYFCEIFLFTNNSFSKKYHTKFANNPITKEKLKKEDINNLCGDGPFSFKALNIAIQKFLQGKHVLLDLPLSNERIQRQFGYFEIGLSNDQEAIFEDTTAILKIDQKCRTEILRYINRCGLNHFLLQNDIENSSKYINYMVERKLKIDKQIEIEDK